MTARGYASFYDAAVQGIVTNRPGKAALVEMLLRTLIYGENPLRYVAARALDEVATSLDDAQRVQLWQHCDRLVQQSQLFQLSNLDVEALEALRATLLPLLPPAALQGAQRGKGTLP